MSGSFAAAAVSGRASPLDGPPLPQQNVGWRATLSALALHAGVVALLFTGTPQHAARVPQPLQVTQLVEIDTSPPSAANEFTPPPPPPQAATPAKPALRAPKSKPRAAAALEPPPPPASVQTGNVASAPDDVVDFGNTILSGTGSHYVGGVSAANGTAQESAGRATPNGVAGGVPGNTGDANVDRSRAARLGGAAVWDCPVPPEADDAGIDHAVVTMRVDVAADGGVLRAVASADPGHGFGREALHCAKHKRWAPALDRRGRAIAGAATVRVRFDR